MNDSQATILIVDDQRLHIEVIRDFLKDSDYTLHTARDGYEAWEILSKSPRTYSTVLLDRIMPRLDGLSVLKKMKEHPELKHIPVIFQTSLTKENHITEGIKAGAYYYLKKPVKKKILKAIVYESVWHHKQRLLLTKKTVEITDAIRFLRFGTFVFRTLEEGNKLATLAGNCCPDSENVVVGLGELIVNAIEHGNLGITYKEKSKLNENEELEDEIRRLMALKENTSKTVALNVEKKNNEIHFTIQDQGKGFDWKSYMDFSPERAFDSHGRGIAMANNLYFDRIEYQGCGNRVVAVVKSP